MARRPFLSDEEILSRARRVFVERGYAASTRQIVAAVGLTWGAIALRFGSKRGLFTQAMAGPLEPAAWEHEGQADLPGLLERLRSHLWEQWPLRLQYRLAATAAGRPGDEPDGLAARLAAALHAHARHGSLRSDMSVEALARVVLALLTGDVAQRFVERERTLKADPAFIGGVIRLLAAK
jgi:AcrR family transcriptional regulator